MYDKLMVVAHPDDESIFGGAELLKERGWKVVCVTCGDNEVRSKEFKKAMEIAGVEHYEIWSYKAQYTKFDLEVLANDLKKVLAEKEYKKVVTHNLEGEYGHIQHELISQVMHSLVKKDLYVFELGKLETDILSFDLLRRKINLLLAYESQKTSINNFRKYIIMEKVLKVEY